jgi:putative intracellular protease/amidase
MPAWYWGACEVLKGRRTAAYPALDLDIKAAGTEFVNAETVVDGPMVSARGQVIPHGCGTLFAN